MEPKEKPVESIADSSDGWKKRIYAPTILAGLVGGGAALVSKNRKTHGSARLAATYAANFAIVAGCYCGARELARDARGSEPDDLVNSMIGGFGSGAILGRLQGGQLGAIKYSVIFAVAGTAVDYATMQLRPVVQSYTKSLEEMFKQKDEKSNSWRMPDWSPIQLLDEEALAAKRAREQKLFANRALGKQEES